MLKVKAQMFQTLNFSCAAFNANVEINLRRLYVELSSCQMQFKQ